MCCAPCRSGETEDDFIADLAVGLSTGQIKTGAPCRWVLTVHFLLYSLAVHSPQYTPLVHSSQCAPCSTISAAPASQCNPAARPAWWLGENARSPPQPPVLHRTAGLSAWPSTTSCSALRRNSALRPLTPARTGATSPCKHALAESRHLASRNCRRHIPAWAAPDVVRGGLEVQRVL